MMSAVSTTLVAALALPLLLLALVAGPTPSLAHGYLSNPPSRQAVCAQGLVTNCGPIIYEPQSVEALKGLSSCNGGIATWAQLADETKAWPTTNLVAGVNSFTWTLTAVHPTASWQYYIGNTQIAQITSASATHSVNLAGYSGRQKILAIWNIGDTANAFYACADVVIGGSSTPTTKPTSAPTTAPTSAPTSAPTTTPTTKPTVAPTTAPTSAPTTKPTTGTGCTTTRTTTSSYTVKAGDSLGAIAATNGVTLAALLAVNPAITNANLIYVAQVINIPKTATVAVSCTTTTPTTTPRRGRSNDTSSDGGVEGFTGSGESNAGTTGLEITKTAVAVDTTSGSKGHTSSASPTFARTSMLPMVVSVTLLGLMSMAFAS